MPKMTVSVPDELLKKLRKSHPEISWAEVVRRGIIRKVEELEKMEELKSKGMI
jgi:predicted CopG family antitoxin